MVTVLRPAGRGRHQRRGALGDMREERPRLIEEEIVDRLLLDTDVPGDARVLHTPQVGHVRAAALDEELRLRLVKARHWAVSQAVYVWLTGGHQASTWDLCGPARSGRRRADGWDYWAVPERGECLLALSRASPRCGSALCSAVTAVCGCTAQAALSNDLGSLPNDLVDDATAVSAHSSHHHHHHHLSLARSAGAGPLRRGVTRAQP